MRWELYTLRPKTESRQTEHQIRNWARSLASFSGNTRRDPQGGPNLVHLGNNAVWCGLKAENCSGFWAWITRSDCRTSCCACVLRHYQLGHGLPPLRIYPSRVFRLPVAVCGNHRNYSNPPEHYNGRRDTCQVATRLALGTITQSSQKVAIR